MSLYRAVFNKLYVLWFDYYTREEFKGMKNLINSDLVTALITECDNIRRREASDIEDDDFEKKNKRWNYLSRCIYHGCSGIQLSDK